jgi:hypothetical protein
MIAEGERGGTGQGEERRTPGRGGPERYPAVDRTDAVERKERIVAEPRSFDPSMDAAGPRQDGEGWLGPRGDPAEGRR